MNDDALLAALNAGGPGSVRILQATFVSVSATGCLVDFTNSRVPAALGTSFLPEVGEVVWVWNIDDRYFIMGPATPKPDRGTVVSVASGLVTLTPSFGSNQIVAPYVGTTPSAGQIMKVLWHGGPFAMLMSTSPSGNTPPPAPGGGVSTHADVFGALDAGSYGSGRWWTSQVYASDSNLGAWFYGTKISDTIPSSASIVKAEVWVPGGTSISGSAPNFALHGYSAKPGGSPTLTSATATAITAGWITLPSGFGAALKAGGGSYGIGVAHGGYNIFPSLAQDGYTGALRITSIY